MTDPMMPHLTHRDGHMPPLRVTHRSGHSDWHGLMAWCDENGLDARRVFLIELVDEGQALVAKWVKMTEPPPVLRCACGDLHQLLYIRERVQIRSLPPQACLERSA